MIIAARYGYKKYKKHQAEKRQQLLEERGQLPDLEDPSKELDATCQAETKKATSEVDQSKPELILTRTKSQRSTRSASSSSSNRSMQNALENDPEFKRYMEQQRQIYLEQRALPPSYHAAVDSQSPDSSAYGSHHHSTRSPNSTLSRYSPIDPTLMSPTTTHCSCHECVLKMQSPVGSDTAQMLRSTQANCAPRAISEMPAEENTISELPVAPTELDAGLPRDSISISPVGFLSELPANLPAILPESKNIVSELPP